MDESRSARSSERQRWLGLYRLERRVEPIMVLLGFLWLGLLIIELGWSLPAALQYVASVIWAVFIADFLLRLFLAPRRGRYLRKNWLTLIALALPALRVLRLFRVLRMLRVVRGLRLVRLLISFNRTLRSLGKTMRRRGVAYVAALTVIVTMAGAAGMYAFERGADGAGFANYSEALWWTAMVVTTLGSQDWPQTPEGKVLCLLLAIYAVAVFTYLAGTVASFFIDRDAAEAEGELASQASIQLLQREIAALRKESAALLEEMRARR